MPAFSSGIDPTLVSTTQYAPLGSEFEESDDVSASGSGPRVWVYVQNDSGGAAIAIGNPVIRKAATLSKVVTQSAAAATSPMRVVGVAQVAIPAGSYGWVLRKGKGTVLNDSAGSLAANSAITISAAVAGSVKAVAAVTDNSFGFVPVAIAVSTTGTAILDCRG